MYSMKEVCDLTGIKYETLKYYCNEGLVPNVKRNENNYRVFDDRDVAWINSLSCLKRCGMGIVEMKEYVPCASKASVPFPNANRFWLKRKNYWKGNCVKLRTVLTISTENSNFTTTSCPERSHTQAT